MTLSGKMMNAAIVLSLTGVSAALLYLALRKRDDDGEIDFNPCTQRTMIESDSVTLEIPIAGDSVGIVIGRQGGNIRKVQEQSKTRIRFRDEVGPDNPRMCVITGSKESVLYAQSLIQDLIRNQPLITTSDMYIPVKTIGRIIGRCGETIQAIIVASGAKVCVDKVIPKDKFAPRRVILKGTVEQMAVARSMIEDKVAEDTQLRQRYEAGASTRSPRNNKSPQYLTAGDRVEAEDEAPHAERLSSMKSDKSLEVYMSAVESPSQFWVQILSPSAAELDQLVGQMTEYYSKSENQELHMLNEVSMGQLVAAPFPQDSKWYRAQVLNATINDYDPAESELELYYVDYGDSYDLKQNQVMELRTDFLKLPPQSIECSLAKVKPIGGVWCDEATDLFEELTHNAQWKVIICKVDHYDPTIQRKKDRGRREGSPVPVVELYNISGPQDINVGEELVKSQFAFFTNPSQSVSKPAAREAHNQSEFEQGGSKSFDEASSGTEVGIKTEPTSVMAMKGIAAHNNSSEMGKSLNSSQPTAHNKISADAMKVIATGNSQSLDSSQPRSPHNIDGGGDRSRLDMGAGDRTRTSVNGHSK